MPDRKSKKNRRSSRRSSRRRTGGGEFSAFLDVKSFKNSDMELKDIVKDYLKNVDTKGVSIDYDMYSTGEGNAKVYFKGDRKDVNRVVRGMESNGAIMMKSNPSHFAFDTEADKRRRTRYSQAKERSMSL